MNATDPHCLNCLEPFSSTDHYCRNCGQKTDTNRLGWHDVAHELFHYFSHTDKSILGLLRGMALQPGIVAWDYIRGRRRHWFSPFTFYLLCISIFALLGLLFHSFEFPAATPDEALLRTMNAQAKVKYLSILHRSAQVNFISSHHSNLISMVSVPFLALVVWAGIRKRGINYVEVLTSLLYFRGFTVITGGLFITVLLGYNTGNLKNYLAVVGLFQIVFCIYSTWGFRQLMNHLNPVPVWKLFLLNLVSLLGWMALSGALFGFYIRTGFFLFN